jgi:hypothetical protein
VRGAVGFLPLTRGNKVLCTKRQLQDCLVELAQEAYAIGFLRGQKEQFGSIISAGVAQRPAWMDLPLYAPDILARHGLQLRPVVVRSLIGAGYHQLGDLCWTSDPELRNLFYVGRKTARQIRTAIRQLQTRPLEPALAGNRGTEERSVQGRP